MSSYGGDLIREARRRAGLTQADLAGRAGTAQPAIARWESGRTAVSLDDVRRLVRLCGFDLEVMLVPRDDSDMAQAAPVSRERVCRAPALCAQGGMTGAVSEGLPATLLTPSCKAISAATTGFPARPKRLWCHTSLPVGSCDI